jgi:hypothetical protein
MPQSSHDSEPAEAGQRVPARPHDSGSAANETVDGLDAATEVLRRAGIVKARAIKEAAGYVIDTIKFFDDQERKQILDQVLSELGSKLVVGRAE